MNKTLTATFETVDVLKSVEDEIINGAIAGFPREKIFIDKEKKEIKIISPTATAGEIKEILQSHNPKSLTERDWTE
ncbi:hypothetical protein SAMN05660860_02244 [Geoalkalibacter ferrihydriticus]|uniref:Uncharacterized protein n=2 Tax=Geoalkalibacter ferrihydriticus TaxID=392333 RepID=A0A0C2HLT1_9BACT|nr:hypothetical protein [Geoalkalibacter ferrihydriticus]KIH78071.1 hypothetical protein GFER_05650 [Geoalkalibacter ferrihydriticus DSM 17813]SDM30692.1 hypothetical protein SAMN05660860_02244 [Geoalkalibacter ferrihydriticus]